MASTRGPVLDDGADLAAGVARGLLHPIEERSVGMVAEERYAADRLWLAPLTCSAPPRLAMSIMARARSTAQPPRHPAGIQRGSQEGSNRIEEALSGTCLGCAPPRRKLRCRAPCPRDSSSSPSSSRAAINLAPWRRSTRRSRAGSASRSCSASPAAARRSPSPRSSRRQQKPTLVLAPNKTLAAQLYGEMRELFPENAVEYFVSYYDYYQPEAYVPVERHVHREGRDHQRRDRPHAPLGDARAPLAAGRDHRRLACPASTASARAESYHGLLVKLEKGEELRRDELLRKLVDIQYERNDVDFHRGTFRVRGDVVEIFPAYEEATAIRVEFFGDEIEAIKEVDPLRGKVLGHARALRGLPRLALRHASSSSSARAIQRDPRGAPRAARLLRQGRPLPREAAPRAAHDVRPRDDRADGLLQRASRTTRATSRGASRASRRPRSSTTSRRTSCSIVDESHQTIPQVGAMYRGDRARKETLVEYGFRLPSALDNRPLKFEEFEQHYATRSSSSPRRRASTSSQKARRRRRRADHPPDGPDRSRRSRCAPSPARSTTCSQRIRERAAKNERVLVTTLTKRMAEDLDRVLHASSACACATCTRTSTRSSASRSCATCGSASSTCSSASTSCARGSTCPRSRSSPSSTPTRRASCAARARSSRPSAAPRAT